MASSLPIDFSHPSVKEYVALIRLQVLTPLATLVSVATILATQFVIRPSLGEIAHIHPTSITPSASLVALYFLVLFAGQIGFCLLLVIAWREDTKKAIVHGVGFPLVLANWLIAGWAVAFSFQAFIASSVMAGLVVLMLLFINLRVSYYYPAAWTSPMEYLLLHLPIRLFLLITMTLLFPLCIFLARGHYWKEGDKDEYAKYAWEGFSVVFGTGILGTIIAAWRADLVWSLGTMWVLWSIQSARPKSAPVTIPIITFTVVIPVVFVGFLLLRMLRKKDRQGQIRLEEEENQSLAHQNSPRPAGQNNPPPGNHEVRTEDVWG